MNPENQLYFSNDTLLLKIMDYSFDNSLVEKPFIQRLAYEYQWTEDYANKALLAYRRYMYMVVKYKNRVLPSIPIAKVWRFHITYSQAYFNDWCTNTLSMVVHYLPNDVDNKYHPDYRSAKFLYEANFSEPFLEYEESISTSKETSFVVLRFLWGLLTVFKVTNPLEGLFIVVSLYFINKLDKRYNPNWNRNIAPLHDDNYTF